MDVLKHTSSKFKGSPSQSRQEIPRLITRNASASKFTANFSFFCIFFIDAILNFPKGRNGVCNMEAHLELPVSTSDQYEFELGPPKKPEMPPPDPGDPSPLPQLDD